MRLMLVLAAAASLSVSSAAYAQSKEHTGPAISVGPHAMMLVGDACRRESSDTVGCSTGTVWTGFHVAPRWRLSDSVALGALGAVSWRPSSTGTASSIGGSTEFGRRMWRLSAEARAYPFGTRPVVPWLAIELGMASVRDSITYEGTPGAKDVAASQYGFFGAAAIASDFYVWNRFALGLELRGVVLSLGKSPPSLGVGEATAYGTQAGLSLGLNLAYD